MEVDAALRGQLDQEIVDSGPPPIGTLVADSVVAGRRLRRQRRTATIAGSAAAVLLLVGGGVVAASTLRTDAAGTGQTVGQAPPPVVAQTSAPPLPQTGLSAEVVLARLIPLLPDGGTISDVQLNTEEYGADVTFAFANGSKEGTITIGVLAGADPARFACHDPKDKTCKRTVTDEDVTVRSLVLDRTDVRVDAGFPDDVIVFIEATRSVLSRTRAVAIATDAIWTEPADQSEMDAAARTVADLT
jgi:hypothetical protein